MFVRPERPEWLQIASALALLFVVAACTADASGSDPLRAPQVVDGLFPSGFLWGVASSAYQVEGNDDPDLGRLRSNWSRWEEMGRIRGAQTNPKGSGFYAQYVTDFELQVDLGMNAVRLGISWERIEPENDLWNSSGLTHYVDVVRAAHDRGLNVMVTFYHWVVPRWVADPALPQGNPQRDHLGVPHNTWLHDQFAEFVAHVVPAIAPYVDLYSVINEPWAPMAGGYLAGQHPPGNVADFAGMRAVLSNLIFMHARAAAEIRRLDTIDADGDGRAAQIGMAQAAGRMLPLDPQSARDLAAAETFQYYYNGLMFDAWVYGNLDVNWDGDHDDTDTVPPEGHYEQLQGALDWIGVNYYGVQYIQGSGRTDLFPGLPFIFGSPNGYPVSEFSTELRADGFVKTIEYFWDRYRLPIFITENGIADCDDNQRRRYLTEHLYALARMMSVEGIDVRGYLHWSLVDNFEWAEGFNQCFGLYAFDPETFARTARPSVEALRRIIAANGVRADELRAAYDSGYGSGGRGSRTLTEVVADIEAEVANGPGEMSLP